MGPLREKLGKTGALTTVSFGLLVGWVVSVLYEGPLLYSLAQANGLDGSVINGANLLALAVGLLVGMRVRPASPEACRRLMLLGAGSCLGLNLLLPLTPDGFWYAGFPLLSLVAGACMTLWGHLLRANVPRGSRALVAPVAMPLACLILTPVHALTTLVSTEAGFVLASSALAALVVCLWRLDAPDRSTCPVQLDSPRYLGRHFGALFLSIFLITTNAGFMFQAVYPLFAEHAALSSLYTNVPYVAAVVVCALFPGLKRLQTLYAGLALWGFSLLLFTNLSLSVPAFFLVITCMLFAAGLFDYFWWSIFTTGIDSVRNPATLVGTILGVTILGSLTGGLITNQLAADGVDPARMAQWGLAAILVNMVLLGVVNKSLAPVLLNRVFLENGPEPTPEEQRLAVVRQKLSPREMEVFLMLREGLSNKDICDQLHISINTVKTHNRKIFAKLGMLDRSDLQEHFPACPLRN